MSGAVEVIAEGADEGLADVGGCGTAAKDVATVVVNVCAAECCGNTAAEAEDLKDDTAVDGS
jgi:hypothetical protein